MVEVPGSSPVTPTTVISFRHPLQVEVPGSSPVTPKRECWRDVFRLGTMKFNKKRGTPCSENFCY